MTDWSGDLRPEELEAMRDEVVAHIASLTPAKRTGLRTTFDATLSRIDERLAGARDGARTAGSAAHGTEAGAD